MCCCASDIGRRTLRIVGEGYEHITQADGKESLHYYIDDIAIITQSRSGIVAVTLHHSVRLVADGSVDGIESGKSQAITNSGGETVGHIGKDSSGNEHLTSNNSSNGQASVASSMANIVQATEIGSQ